MKSNKPKRGDVWLVDFDEVRKDEVGKIRPALIVQNDEINKHYNSTIVIPFSIPYNRAYGRVSIPIACEIKFSQPKTS